MSSLRALQTAIQQQANPEKALFLNRFFKTGPGQYAAGDQMLGIPVPAQRALAKLHHDLPTHDLQKLLHSPFHEERLVALLIVTLQFETCLKSAVMKSGDIRKTGAAAAAMAKAENMVNFYLSNTAYINNWDLVDLTAYKIIGRWLWLQNHNHSLLLKLAESTSLWEKRIAIISTLYFIKQNFFRPTLEIAIILLHDRHDLIHKAVGWMLREIGKQNPRELDIFLLSHYRQMPRTMLRYAIEKYPPSTRKKYLFGRNLT